MCTGSVERGCLMSDDTYKAPLSEPEIPPTADSASPFVDSKTLWILFGLLFGSAPVVAAFLPGGSGSVLSVKFAVGVSAVLLSLIAIRSGWRPVIPCMMYGSIVGGILWTLASDTPESPAGAAVSIAGMFVGGLIGCFFYTRRHTFDDD